MNRRKSYSNSSENNGQTRSPNQRHRGYQNYSHHQQQQQPSQQFISYSSYPPPHSYIPQHSPTVYGQYQQHSYHHSNNYNNNPHSFNASHTPTNYHQLQHHHPSHHQQQPPSHDQDEVCAIHNNAQNRTKYKKHKYKQRKTQRHSTDEARTSHSSNVKSTDIEMNCQQQKIKRIKHRDSHHRVKSSKHWILQSGYRLNGTKKQTKYRIIKCIGKGRFSHVFSAFDEASRQNVAVKVDTNPKEKELLDTEYRIMKEFMEPTPCPYICQVYDLGKLPNDMGVGNYLCMELCDEKNLSDQRKECPTKCFGIQRGALIGIEMILSLKAFHEKNYVHRDIKPSNFVLPTSKHWPNHIFIVDFGLSTTYNQSAEQKEAEFIGTSLYASLTAHKKLDLSPVDDLWSLLFVIIAISTNSLPWKPLYIQLENQAKLRRQSIAKMKEEFIQFMLGNNATFGEQFPYKMPSEYVEFIRVLNGTNFNQTPKYDELIGILRRIALNEQYDNDQYVADHAPEMVDRPLHTNFEILNEGKLCCSFVLGECETKCGECPLGLHPTKSASAEDEEKERNICRVPLCKEYVLTQYCSSNRPRGSWCGHGYHWTLNDQMHFRNSGILPQAYIGTNDICTNALEKMECHEADCKEGEHPKNGMKFVWNASNTFSQIKPFWGEEDVSSFYEIGLFPIGINAIREKVNVDNMKEQMNVYVLNKFEDLIGDDSIFAEEDFMSDAVIDALFKLNVSQSMNVLIDIYEQHKADQSLIDNDKRRQFIINELTAASTKYLCPLQCKVFANDEEKRRDKKIAIEYPALHAKKLKLTVDPKQIHKANDENAQTLILKKFEEFVRIARGKTIGNEIIPSLMAIPSEESVKILNVLQQKDVQKISVIQSAIKSKCDKFMNNVTQTPVTKGMQRRQSVPNRYTHSAIKQSVGIGLPDDYYGSLGISSVPPKTKSTQSSSYHQQKSKFDYSRPRNSSNRKTRTTHVPIPDEPKPIVLKRSQSASQVIIQSNKSEPRAARISTASNPSTAIKKEKEKEIIESKPNVSVKTEESSSTMSTSEDFNMFKMLIPKKKHLITNDTKPSPKSEKSVKKVKKTKTKKKKKPKKNKKIKKEKSKKREISKKKKSKTTKPKKEIKNKRTMEQEEDDEELPNVVMKRHRRRTKRAINDSSDDGDGDNDDSNDYKMEIDHHNNDHSDESEDDDEPIGIRHRDRKRKRDGNEALPPNKKRRKRQIATSEDSQDEDEEDVDNDNNAQSGFDWSMYTTQRPKRNTVKNVSYREEDGNMDVDAENVDESLMPSSLFSEQNMNLPFSQIFASNRTEIASTEYNNDSAMRAVGFMTTEQCTTLNQQNKKIAKKEIYRDVAIELVRENKKEIDENTIIQVDSDTKCYVCTKDPSDMEWELLLCDYCMTGAAHCRCLDPPYSTVPEDKWACQKCQDEIIAEHKEEYDKTVAERLCELENEFKAREDRLEMLIKQRQTEDDNAQKKKKNEQQEKNKMSLDLSSLPHIPSMTTPQHLISASFCNQPVPQSFNAPHPQFKQELIAMPNSFGSNVSQTNVIATNDKFQNLLPNIHGSEHIHQTKAAIAPYQYDNNMNAVFSPSAIRPQSFGIKSMNAMPMAHLHAGATNSNNKNNAFYNPNPQIFSAHHLPQAHIQHSLMNNNMNPVKQQQQHMPTMNHPQMTAGGYQQLQFNDFLNVLNNSNSAKNTNNKAKTNNNINDNNNNNSAQSPANMVITNLNVVNIKCDSINNMMHHQSQQPNHGQTLSNQSSPSSHSQSQTIDHHKIS